MAKKLESLKAARPEIFPPCMEAKDEIYWIDGPLGRDNGYVWIGQIFIIYLRFLTCMIWFIGTRGGEKNPKTRKPEKPDPTRTVK